MKYGYAILLSFFFIAVSCAQVPADRPHLANEKFDKEITSLIRFSVPVISVQELHANLENYIVLDTREKEEFDVSHIPGAIHIGYDKFDASLLTDIPKDTNIVLYCSVGYRSEKIGNKLQKKGFSNVNNLFGSIFEWVNQGYTIVDNKNHPIHKVHTYNKKWSQWVDENKAVKIW